MPTVPMPSPAGAVASKPGASKTGRRPVGFAQMWVFVAMATAEIVLASFLTDTPRTSLNGWQPMLYANAIAKVAIVGFCLLVLATWPRRAEIMAVYRETSAQRAFAPFVIANVALFVLLIGFRIAVAGSGELPASAMATYCVLLFATGASLAFLAAAPAFWWVLPKIAPLEVAIAITGGVFGLWFSQIAQDGWTVLASATLTVSHWMLTLYESNVVLDADKWILGVGDFTVYIHNSCSGYEGIALILVFVPVYMWIFRRDLRFPNVLLLLPLGVAAIWLLNSARIAALISIGAHVSPEVAVQGFHSQAGWISFLFVTLATVALTRRIPFFAAPSQAHRATPAFAAADAATDRSLAYLGPFIALIAAGIVASAFAPHDHWLYGLKVVGVMAVLWAFRDVYRPLVRDVSWFSVAVGLAIGVLWIATEPALGAETALGTWIATLPAGIAIAWLAVRVFGSVVLVPIAEELAFRGFLARWLVSIRFEAVAFNQFRLLAFVVSSLAFGLVHDRWLAATLAGAVYGLLMYRSNRLSDPIAAHAASNLAIAGWAVSWQEWGLL